jgi:hypothetical protein
VRILYYSFREAVLVEKANGNFTVIPCLREKGSKYAYLHRMEEVDDLEFGICDEKLVNMYNDPDLIYSPEVAGIVDELKKRGVKVFLSTPGELEAYLKGWTSLNDNLLKLYWELVSVEKQNADLLRQAMRSLKVDAVLAKQPDSVQSIYRFIEARTLEWKSKGNQVYGVPLSMVVNEVRLKEDTVRAYIKLLQRLNLIKINLRGKQDYYLPVER